MEVGAWGERSAEHFLRREDLTVLKRNWLSGSLEADLVALQERTIVIIEVKTRHESLREYFPALGAVDQEKRRRLTILAHSFIRNNGPLCRRFGLRYVRIDAVEVYYRKLVLLPRQVSDVVWRRGLPEQIS